MKNNTQHSSKSNQSEKGQALVMSAGILFVLAITFMFYMSIQRAYNLANFLDETAELAAQAAAEPIADDLVNGNVRVDETDAIQKAEATVELLASISSEVKDEITKLGDTTTDPDELSRIRVDSIRVINPGDTLEVRDPICEEFSNSATDPDLCTFPIVVVSLSLPHWLFGVEFDISTRGVATLGANASQPEAVPVTLPDPTALPTAPPIVIPVNP